MWFINVCVFKFIVFKCVYCDCSTCSDDDWQAAETAVNFNSLNKIA